jgi:hypothetical protein
MNFHIEKKNRSTILVVYLCDTDGSRGKKEKWKKKKKKFNNNKKKR